MKNKIIIIVLAVVLAAGAAFYFLVFKNTGEEKNELAELYNYSIDDSFVTNVKDSSKLFKATVILVVNEKGLDDFLDTNQYVIRDTVLFIMRSLTEEDIRSSDIQDKLRATIPLSLNNALKIDNVVSVYFGDFVMQ